MVVCSPATWKGQTVYVYGDDPYWPVNANEVMDVLNCNHELEVMHHHAEGDIHYCPTMFLQCRHCSGIADEPEPYECERWGA